MKSISLSDPLCWIFKVTCKNPNWKPFRFKNNFLLNKAGGSSSGTILRMITTTWEAINKIKPKPYGEQVILQILLFNYHSVLTIRKFLDHWRYGQSACGWWKEMLREVKSQWQQTWYLGLGCNVWHPMNFVFLDLQHSQLEERYIKEGRNKILLPV